MRAFIMMQFLGLLITSSFSLKSPIDPADIGNVMIPSNQNVSTGTSTLDDLVDAKCKQYTAGLQDQVNELKAKVDRLEVNKVDQNLKNNDYSLAKGMRKRDVPKALKSICSTSSSLCTHYHPDHPDASSKKGKYSPIVNNEMLSTKGKGIPTSCKDLQQIGYSLNGLYLIKKSLPNNGGAKIQTVFCEFQLPTSSNVVQELIGTLEVKTKTVHFYVQRESDFGTTDAVIPFELARLNEGSAFDLASGVFTVPVPGIYHFDLTALKEYNAITMDIVLQVNNENIGCAYTGQGSIGTYDTLSLSTSLQLAAGDRVNLFKRSGGVLHDNLYHYTHFTGWLVEENLM